MKHLILINLLFVIICFGCISKTSQENIAYFKPDPGKAKSISLNELAQDVRVIVLDIPQGFNLGGVESIRATGDYFILHDGLYSNSLTVFDHSGKFVSQLSSIGRGPGEYYGCNSFALIENNTKIIVNDRGVKFLLYSFPDFEFISSFEDKKYYMSMESLGGEYLLTISDTRFSTSEFIGVELLNINNFNSERLNLPAKPSIIDLSYQNTLTHHIKGAFYCSPGFYTSIFDISIDSLQKIALVDFGKYNMPEEVWGWDSPEKFETVFWSTPKATWVQFFNRYNGYGSFYFAFSQEEQRFFSICNFENAYCEVFKNITLFNSFSFLPSPFGLFDGYYITWLTPWQVKELVPDKYDSVHIWEKQLIMARENEHNVLLLYKPNLPL